MLTALADLAHRRPRRVIALAFALTVTAGVLGGSVADRLHPYGAEDPSSESVRFEERMREDTRADPDVAVIALVDSGRSARSPQARARVEQLAREIRRDPAIARVTTAFSSRNPAMISRDGRLTYLTAQTGPVSDKELQEAAKRIEQRLAGEPDVRLGGEGPAARQVNATVEHDLKRAELLAFPLLFLLSLIFFRSLVAALLPLLVGALAIVATFCGLRLANELGPVSIFALNLTTGLGLGLAIDSSLFMVSRYREELARSGPGREALVRTLSTAGRTVLFSSLTVAAALASLLVFPQRFLFSMGLGGAMVALIAAAISLVVLPAVLALLGERVNSLAPRWLQRAAERDARPASSGAWYRLSRLVTGRALMIALASAAVLVALGLPFRGIEFTKIDATVLPPDAEARQVNDVLERDFPPFRTTPINLLLDTRDGRQADAFVERLRRTPGVAEVGRPVAAGSHGLFVPAFSDTGALSERSQELVRELRRLPAGFDVLVGGEAAEFVDLKASLVDHLPLALSIVVAMTVLILFLMTGSVVLPLKALVMNALTLCAAFGILVLVFQDGRLEGLLDYKSQGALETTMPILLFALAFGLSTDYGVFLLSRIKEARDAGASDSEAVAIGLERTGRIVTAAAALFCVAIGAFATSEIIFVKENGIGTAVAVLIDATIVRALLVPSLMELLGSRNWWSPRPLRRLRDRVHLGEPVAPDTPAAR